MNDRVYAIIVTYHSDPELLIQQYDAIKGQVAGIIYIDNGTSQELPLKRLSASSVFFVFNQENAGLGKAQNQGILLAKEKGATHILLLDQDSIVSADMVCVLLSVERDFLNKGIKVGLVGPEIRDVLSSPPHDSDAIIFCGSRIKRVRLDKETLSVSYCIASGSLIAINVLEVVGLLREELFIDGLDVEWCLRAKSLGYQILMTPHTVLKHRLGNGAKEKVLSHSPIREYYICRNSILLSKYRYIPRGYRWRKIVFVPLRIFTSLSQGYWPYFKAGFAGMLDGIRNRIRIK